jgi:ribosome recycling factor
MEEIQMFLEEAEELMSKAVAHTSAEFLKIRAGKATPNMLDGIRVNYYGNITPLNQVSSITTPDARSIVIKPWEKSLIHEIEKAIMNSDLGLNPQNDGDIVRLNIPMLTEDRRKDLVKQAKHEAETGKISIRNIRKDTNESLKKLLKEGAPEDEVKTAETKVQALTDKFVKKIDELLAAKEVDIMTV